MNLGLLGGTFDPPHLGHIHLAHAAREEMGLDAILFVPCRRQPLKKDPPEASSWHRVAMLALALSGRPDWMLSTAELEADGDGVSYTADTLAALTRSMPGHRWTLLLGADSLESFPLWRGWRDILGMARVAAAARDAGSALKVPEELAGDGVVLLGARATPAQSRVIRQVVREGGDASPWLSPEVRHYIARQGLYLGGRALEAALKPKEDVP